MKKINACLLTLICMIFSHFAHAEAFTNIRSGSWYDATIWNTGRVPSVSSTSTDLNLVTIAANTTVTVLGSYTDCDGLTVDGFLDIGASNLTIGGRDLQTDVRAVRNASVIVNGRLRITGDFSTQFKVYGNVKFNTGSTFDMSAGAIMIDGCAYTDALSVPANTPLLDVTDATNFNSTGGLIIIFNPHRFQTGLTIKGAKTFHNVSFGNVLDLPNFGCRSASDFLISDVEKPIFNNIRLAYLPYSVNPNNPTNTVQNRVVLNNISVVGNIDLGNGILVGTGRLKVGSNLLLGGNVSVGALDGINTDIEFNGSEQQNISTYSGNSSAIIKGNIYANNVNRVQTSINLDVQNGTINMIRGKFDLNNKTVSVASAPTGASASTYIVSHNQSAFEGTLVVKNITGRTLFPVGTEMAYLPVTLTAASGDFSVSAKPLLLSVGNQFSILNQWDINRVSGSAPADLEVQWNPGNESKDFGDFRYNCRLHRYNGSIWQPVGGVGASVNGTVFTATAQNVQNFSPFTMLTEVNLPVELKSFVGKIEGNNARLFWETATEINNLGFEIEKSTNQNDFLKIGFVKGVGNSVQLNAYNFVDNAFEKTAYYRLKQLDMDGKFSYSPVIALQKSGLKVGMKIYPNPLLNQNTLNIDFEQNNKGNAFISVFESSGKAIYQKNVEGQDATQINVNDWSRGLYLIRLTTNEGKIITSKFVKE
jgi:Secretion system C-terminal sorting domain